MINVIVIECDYGHVHSLASNELFSDPQKAKKRFSELIIERNNSANETDIKTALEKGIYQIGFTTLLLSNPVRKPS